MSRPNSTKPIYFDNRPFGMIREKAHDVYARCEAADGGHKWKYAAVKDSHRETNSKILKTAWPIIRDGEVYNETSTEHPGTVLSFFFELHRYLRANWAARVQQNFFTREFKFCEVLFLEVNAILTYEMEYLLMMYMGFLNMGVRMPQLFVIVDYPTSAYDFIATDILNRPIVPWETPRNPRRIDGLYPSELGSDPLSLILTGYKAGMHENEAGILHKTHIIISSNNLYKKVMEKQFEGKPGFYVSIGLQSYESRPPIDPSDKQKFDFIIVDSAETVLDYLRELPARQAEAQERNQELKSLTCDVLIFDEYTRMRCNAHYANNIPMGRLMNPDYVKSRVWELKNAFPYYPKQVYIHQSETKGDEGFASPRETLERNTINDILTMLRYGIDIASLYSMYYKPPGSRAFISALRSNKEILKDLGYNDAPEVKKLKDGEDAGVPQKPKRTMADKINRAPQLKVHPIMIAFIDEWFERGLPKMDILIFVAVASTPADNIEVRQAGSREHKGDINSEFARRYIAYLRQVAEWGCFTRDEGGKTAECLRRLIQEYQENTKELQDTDFLLPDFGNFSRFFTKMVSEKFSKMTLTRKGHHDYRGVYNLQMNWTITVGEQVPIRILPIVAKSHKNGRHVRLYVPLD